MLIPNLTRKIKTAIHDVESDGLLPDLTRIHVLAIYDFENKKGHVFRRNDKEDTINDGLDLLEDAELVVGWNNLYCDKPAIEKVYGQLNWSGKHRDCLVASRMIFSNQKEKDFRLWENGKLPGKLIGSHTLESWGYRLGLHKGDYAKVMREEALSKGLITEKEISDYTWGRWNQPLEDYCCQDLNVTAVQWQNILRANYSEQAMVLEHQIHDLMGRQSENGIDFNLEEANKLADELKTECDRLVEETKTYYGSWYTPVKRKQVGPLWVNEDEKTKKVSYAPRGEGEDDENRAIYAEVTLPKRNVTYADVLRGSYSVDAPYCKIELKDFNPASRPQVIDRFTTRHNWHPSDFTDKGNPEVNDEVLRKLGDAFETEDAKRMAYCLAEIFYYKKRIGQLKTGKVALIKNVQQDGRIHGYVNVGGTVSGRASHVAPNTAQVPKVGFAPILGPDGEPLRDNKGKVRMQIAKGRAGDHGWDFRNLFYVKAPWEMLGVDLEGIELRCFGEKLSKYDGGEYLKLVLSGDPHTYNQNLAGLPTRDNAKTFIYALLYGAGDIKLGSIVAPLASIEKQRALGVMLRARFMKGLSAYADLIKDIKTRVNRDGYIRGLDGRRLHVRSPHSALNTELQSDAALIAKKWVLLTEQHLEEDEGLYHSWDGDFVHLLWIHDEIQMAARNEEIADKVRYWAVKSAREAGEYFGYSCPVDAAPKSGHTWAETH